MDWTNELFVRLYVRDTADWKVLPWQARALFPLVLRRVDRAGVLETRHGPRGVAALLDVPIEFVDAGLPALIEDGVITQHDRGYLLPNYIEAQECLKSDRARAKEYRDKRRAKAISVTARDVSITARDLSVTPHHAASREITARHSKIRREEKRLDEERREPSPSGLRLAEALRDHLIAEKPDHALAADETWRRRRAGWARAMAPIAAKRTEESALELMAWVFGDQGGRAEYRFRVDSPKALGEKFDRIETAMRTPQVLRAHGTPARGLTSEELWKWGDDLEREERAKLGGGS